MEGKPTEELLKMDKIQLIRLIEDLQHGVNRLTALNDTLITRLPYTEENWDLIMGNISPKQIAERELSELESSIQAKIDTLMSILQRIKSE